MFVKRFLSLFLLLVLPSMAMQRMHDPLERFLHNHQRSLNKHLLQKNRSFALQQTNTPWNSRTFKYDDILTFLDELESGELEKRCSDGDLEQINQFVADLAREGYIPGVGCDPQELERDIEELLGISDPYAFRYAPPESSTYELTPALYYGDYEVVKCGWFKKTWKKTKKFCKKHKKAIIITAVVVVVVTTAVVVAAAASSSAAAGGAAATAGGAEGGAAAGAGGAAAGAAAIGASSSKKSDNPSTTPGVNDAIASRPDPTPPTPPQSPKSKSPQKVEEIVGKHIHNFKESVAEERPAIDLAKPNEPLPFEEAARVHGAYTAREAVTEILGPDPSHNEQPLTEIDHAFGVQSASLTRVGAVLAAGRMASRAPGGLRVRVVAGVGAAAYALYDPEGVEKAHNAVCEGAGYVADKALEGVIYVKDRAIEAAESVASWAAGSQPTTSLESRSGEGVADDRVLQPPDEYFENFPDRKLPHKYGGEPLPDVDAPHTQLGTREGSKTGTYKQAREFDEAGKPIKDFDFTDHGLPDVHPNPHYHDWVENETGGTKKRDKNARPLEEPPNEISNE